MNSVLIFATTVLSARVPNRNFGSYTIIKRDRVTFWWISFKHPCPGRPTRSNTKHSFLPSLVLYLWERIQILTKTKINNKFYEKKKLPHRLNVYSKRQQNISSHRDISFTPIHECGCGKSTPSPNWMIWDRDVKFITRSSPPRKNMTGTFTHVLNVLVTNKTETKRKENFTKENFRRVPIVTY